MRLDPTTGIYRDCKQCRGRGVNGHGCIFCQQNADSDYKAAFPSGPEPVATFKLGTAEHQAFKELLGKVMRKADEGIPSESQAG